MHEHAIAVFASDNDIAAYMRGEEIKPELPGMPKVFVEYQEKLSSASVEKKNNSTFADMKGKHLKERKESLQTFADSVLSSKIAKNEVKYLGKIDKTVITDMNNNGIELLSDKIFITDKIVLKYLNHPKAMKGAVIDLNRFSEIEHTIKNPANIYADIKSQQLVYIYASPYDEKSLKAVIHPNYTLKGNVFNLLKSIGIIERWHLDDKTMYRKIK